MNSGVCISSAYGDYYGKLVEVLELEYPALPLKQTVLFKCDWYDPTPNLGIKVHEHYKLVDINQRRRYKKFEPFVLAMQATQVCFIPYPSRRKNMSDWLAVCKAKPRGWRKTLSKDDAFQLEEGEDVDIDVTSDIGENRLSDDSNVLEGSLAEEEEEIEEDDDDEEVEDDEPEFEYDLSTEDDEEDYKDDSD